MTEEVFDPRKAGICILEGIPKKVRERYRRRALAAPTSYPAAVMLKCLDCCGWEYKEVKLCQITACPLYGLRSRLFGDAEGDTVVELEAAG